MVHLKDIRDACLHLLFPHLCEGCGNDLLNPGALLCLRCLESLPATRFEIYAGNPVEKRFYGRLPVEQAAALYYFTKDSLVAKLVHLVKYKGHQKLGIQLGRMMGDALLQSGRFPVDALVALPIFPAREKKRGYNQSALLCEGMAEYLNLPILEDVISRPHQTETQTKKGRIARWKNIEGKFILTDPPVISGKHILLVDDVITTGATLESCGAELLKAPGCSLSIACLCHAFN